MAKFSDDPAAQAALTEILADLGPMAQAVVPPDDEIQKYLGRVPDILLDLWSDTGVGDLRGGMLRLCLPVELAPQMARLFADDPDFGFPKFSKDTNPMPSVGGDPPARATDVHAVAHTPFGDLLLWSERHGLMHVNIVQGLIEAPFLFAPDSALAPDTAALDLILKVDPFLLDMDDRDLQPMFAAALEAFGPLKRMFIYAPGPAATHDPIPTLDGLFPHAYPEWLQERITSKEWTLTDLATRRLNVRRIGPQPEPAR